MSKNRIEVSKRRLQIGDVTFHVLRSFVEKKEIPLEYAALLINDKTQKQATALLQQIRQFTQHPTVEHYLIQLVIKNKVEEVLQYINKYKKDKPTEKVKLYQDISGRIGGKDYPAQRIAVIQGNFGVSFGTDFEAASLNLPLNRFVYCNPLLFCIKQEEYDMLEGRFGKLLDLTMKLQGLSRITWGRISGIVETFATDPEKAQKLYERAKREVEIKNKKDEIYNELISQGYVQFKAGYLLRYFGKIYIVTKAGEAFQIKSSKTTSRKSMVYAMVQKNRLPVSDKLEPITTDEDKVQVARLIGKIRPELAVVLSP